MRKGISAFTPSNTDPEVLKRIFVQRQKLLGKLISIFGESAIKGDLHQMLLVGPRGAGKTHLVTLTQYELNNKPEIRDKIRIAWLGEDETFTNVLDLVMGIAGWLKKTYPKEFTRDYAQEISGIWETDQSTAARVVLNRISEDLGKRKILLITENLHRTFEAIGQKGQELFRSMIQETGLFAILATSQQLFEAVFDRSRPFFGFFEIQHLNPLSVDDARELIANISKEVGKQELADFLNTPIGRYRIRALHYLAGGNHRIYVLLSEFLTKDNLEDLVSAFEELAEGLTSYYQERLRSLSPQQARIIETLAEADGALTVKELSARAFVKERSASKQLGELSTLGYVDSEKRGKETFYELSEPLMRLTVETKNSRGTPLRLVTQFLKAWFSVDDFNQRGARDLATNVVSDEMTSILQGSLDEILPTLVGLNLNRNEDWMRVLLFDFLSNGSAEVLGNMMTKSVAVFGSERFTASDLKRWLENWEIVVEQFRSKRTPKAGKASIGVRMPNIPASIDVRKELEKLEIPLKVLRASYEAIKTKSDRPLFQLPREIRQLIRPLLNHTLGVESSK
ncbi:MAG: hypothetical protein R2684_15225 [Pyrinomonadaceae bacterium]